MKQKKINTKPLSIIEWDTCWMAIRYAMNRNTISSVCLPGELLRAYYHRWTEQQKEAILEDLKLDHKDTNPIDNRVWSKFMGVLDKSQHIKVILIDDTEETVFKCNNRIYPLSRCIENLDAEIYVPEENIKQEVWSINNVKVI